MISKEEVLKIAKLAKLSVSEDEIEKLTQEMANIIDFADTIATAEIEVTDFDNINNMVNVLREDEVVESYKQEEILKNVEDRKGVV